MVHVLAVDDSPSIRQLVRLVLEPEGYQVTEAADGAEALAQLREAAQPVVVVLDYQMPVMDGEQVLRAVATAGQPLTSNEYLILSANTSTFPQSLIELLRHLSIRVMSKPVERATLIAAVGQAAERLNDPQAEPVPWERDK